MEARIESPESLDALRARVRACLDERRPLLTVGGGTRQNLGPRAVEGNAVTLSLRCLKAIDVEHPGDLVVSAQAGARLEEVQATLAPHGQWLPIDVANSATSVGGALATGASGSRRLGYGTLRDHLIGLEVLGASGELTKSGGRVVKNVTGFDLHKLHIGAFGSLGVLLRAWFKVRPVPAASVVAGFGFATLEAAHGFSLAVFGSQLRPVALDAIAGDPLLRLREKCPALPTDDAVALIGIEGSRQAVARQLRDLESLRPPATRPVLIDGERAQTIWRTTCAGASDAIVVRVGARPTDLAALLVGLQPRRGILVHTGIGIARLWLASPSVALQRWQEQAAAIGGYAIAESAPLDLPARDRLPWSTIESPLCRALKKTWDPHDLFNPGRMAL